MRSPNPVLNPRRQALATVLATALGTCALACAAIGASPALAQPGFPDKPIRVVVPFAAGNVLDVSLRQVGDEFRKITGQPLIVDNRPGGGGIIAAQTVANATPDGYTLLLSSVSQLTVNPHTYSKLPYDARKSFSHITGFLGTSLVMAVNASVPANTLPEFVTWAKGRGKEVTYASFTAGNSSHFMGVLLNQRAGLEMVHVAYNGTPPAVQDLLGQQVHAAFLPLMAVKPHMESGRVKVLAISTPERLAMIPQVQTFKEAGYPDLTSYIWSGLSAPAGTPDAVVKRLNETLNEALRHPDVRSRWAAFAAEPMPMTPAEFDDLIDRDSRRWAEAVRLSGFKAAE